MEPSTFEVEGGVGSFVVGCKGASRDDSLCGLDSEGGSSIWM